jgi:hypothetical protein
MGKKVAVLIACVWAFIFAFLLVCIIAEAKMLRNEETKRKEEAKYDNIRDPFWYQTLPSEPEGDGQDGWCQSEYDKPLAQGSRVDPME